MTDHAISRPLVTEEMVERGARVLADAIGEPVYTAETADVVRHILTAALGTPAAGPATRTGALGMKYGDRVEMDGRFGKAGEFFHDGEVEVHFDDGRTEIVKWGRIRPASLFSRPTATSIRAEATKAERERCAGDAFMAALFSYLFNQCAYSYGGSSASEPSPAEFGISWSWQKSKPCVPRMIDQLAEDALQYFERYINEMDPGDEPTDWDREVMRHAAAIRGGGE